MINADDANTRQRAQGTAQASDSIFVIQTHFSSRIKLSALSDNGVDSLAAPATKNDWK